MKSSLNHDIRRRLARYIKGEASLEAFDEWFAPATWGVDKTGDQQTIDLTYEIILRLAEYSNGDCTEEELKQILRPLTETATASRASS